MKKEKLTVETDKKGTIRYYNANDQLHNPNGPAVVRTNGYKEHWIHGKLHNPNGPAVVWADGYKEHWINGKRHNPNGPAIVGTNGRKSYYINGKRHNPHGPAAIWPNGHKEYYINGKELTESEFAAWQAQQDAPLHNKTATIDGIDYTLTAK
jgi:hypothetical protein